jgi:prepilin-type N-terminal cleavage/methylation domain-containing protein
MFGAISALGREMAAKISKSPFRSGLSLVETMVALAILSVGVIAATNYRYYAALDARRAAMYTAAAGIGQMLCESWRGVEGDETYDPATYFGSNLEITPSTGPDKPEGFTLLGSYTVQLNGVSYYVTMSWKKIYTGLRALNVVVAWVQREQAGSDIDDANKSFKLTTYILR